MRGNAGDDFAVKSPSPGERAIITVMWAVKSRQLRDRLHSFHVLEQKLPFTPRWAPTLTKRLLLFPCCWRSKLRELLLPIFKPYLKALSLYEKHSKVKISDSWFHLTFDENEVIF